MKHLYDYSLMVKFFPIASVGGVPLDLKSDANQGEVAKAIGMFAAKDLPQAVSTHPGGEGWEVNSHSITMVGNALAFSVLLQRRNS